MRSVVYKPDFTPRQLTFGQVPCFAYTKSLDDELAAGLTQDDAIFMLRLMLYNRAFEETIVRLRSGDLVPHEGYKFSGATHLSIGQEAVAVGANAALRADDYITSSHRGHGHSIAKEAYALKAMSDAQLQAFIDQVSFVSDKSDLFEKALEVHLYRTMAEFMGKEEGYCRGRGGGMHIADFNVGHLGANAIVGGSIPIATGAGMSVMLQGGDKVVLCFFGDGAANNGVFGESLNMASMSQFNKGVPVIFLIENNQFGMSGRCYGEVTGVDFLARRGWAYKDNGMHAEVVNGMDVLAMRDAVLRATEICRKGDGPVLLEAVTYRYKGHSLSDQNAYRTKDEIEAWMCEDALGRMKQQIVRSGLMGPEQVEQMEHDYHEQMEKIAVAAARSEYPAPETVCEGLYSDSTSDNVPAEYRTTDYDQIQIKNYRDGQRRMPHRRAILEALIEEMIRDKRVVVYGEDVAEYGGAFAVTAGLIEIFGRHRVFNTGVSEATICGSAVGMAMTGMRPVVELMYIDFILMSMDQLGNQAAKNKYMFGGKAKIPMVCRIAIGGGKGYAGQHSQSLEAIATHLPGLKVVAPSTAHDAKGLLKTAIRDDNPVIFLEHQLLYGDRGEVPEGEYLVPFGKAAVRAEGGDVTILAYSYMAKIACEAAEMLAEKGISADVIDVRSLIPLDVDTIIESVKKTNHAVVVCQAPGTGCYGEHIVFEIQKRAFDYLDAPIELVAAYDCPPPMAPTLEEEFMPNKKKVFERVMSLLGK
ncbi:MAG TPA: dehydrogenase E1 component subunit alpha/beta [Sedimentisphaerales bacterium]|nr:dehydrogenase E1 component subunit alpha/beta [Sedimentisphaerales bacterium]